MGAFWESVASNVIGTFIGAGLALVTSFLVVRHGETRNDARLIQSLVDRLYRTRALRQPLERLCSETRGVNWREIGTADLRSRVPGPTATGSATPGAPRLDW